MVIIVDVMLEQWLIMITGTGYGIIGMTKNRGLQTRSDMQIRSSVATAALLLIAASLLIVLSTYCIQYGYNV